MNWVVSMHCSVCATCQVTSHDLWWKCIGWIGFSQLRIADGPSWRSTVMAIFWSCQIRAWWWWWWRQWWFQLQLLGFNSGIPHIWGPNLKQKDWAWDTPHSCTLMQVRKTILTIEYHLSQTSHLPATSGSSSEPFSCISVVGMVVVRAPRQHQHFVDSSQYGIWFRHSGIKLPRHSAPSTVQSCIASFK